MQNWDKHKVYEEAEDIDQKVISIRWVITQKYKDSKITSKARLVARGFEEENLQESHKDSPICCKGNFRLILWIISKS